MKITQLNIFLTCFKVKSNLNESIIANTTSVMIVDLLYGAQNRRTVAPLSI